MLHLRDTLSFLLPTLLLIAFALAAPYQTPTVSLGETTFVGKFVGGTEKFLGIRYAEAPRYKLPIPVTSYGADWIDVSRHGSACPQQPFRIETSSKWVTGILKKFIDGLFEKHLPESEDCLNLDIVRPIGTSTGSKLPVVVWIYGGAFLTGYTGLSVYDGKRLVELSQMLGQPMIFVAINYRLGGWGFLDSKDVRDAGVGNLGLHDQREALRWVQRNIAAFGGDPARVTAWGESAGAISIGFHMLANGGNTEGLFHAAIMQSGAYLPIAPGEGAQSKYDALVNLVGCQNEQNKLECLRKVPYETLKTVLRDRGDAFNCSGPIPTWIPRVDGTLLNQVIMDSISQGRRANIPIMYGNTADEGTYFALWAANVTNNASFKDYIRKDWFDRATEEELDKLINLYPSDPKKVAEANGPAKSVTMEERIEFGPQFPRLSLFLGDGIFHGPRRWMLQHSEPEQKSWVYNYARWKHTPILGSFHALDIFNTFKRGELQTYLVNFVNYHNPNPPNGKKQKGIIPWPQYDLAQRQQLELQGGLRDKLVLTQDTYRSEAIEYIQSLSQKYPIIH